MRTLLFLRCSEESHLCDPQAIAAKVRQLVSSAGLRLIEFSTQGEERAVMHRSFSRFFALESARGPGLRGGEGEGESKDSLERSSFTADASTRVRLRQRNTRKKRQIPLGAKKIFI